MTMTEVTALQKELQQMLLVEKTVLAYFEPLASERNLRTSQVLAMHNLTQAEEYLLSLMTLRIVGLKAATMMPIYGSD